MNRIIPWMALTAASLLLSACNMQRSVVVEQGSGVARGGTAMPGGIHAPGGTYVVAKGDTLYSIAFRNGVDFRSLAQWNNIATPYTIWPGQSLTLSPTGHPAVVAAPPPSPPPAPPRVATASQPVFQPVPVTTNAAVVAQPAAVVARTAVPPPPKVAAVPPPVAVVPVAGVPPPASVPPPAPVVAAGASRSIGGVAWRWPAQGSLAKRFQSGDAIPGVEIAGNVGDPVRAAADGVVVYSGNGLVGYGELVIIKHSDSLLSAYGHNSKRLVKEGQRVSAGQEIAQMGSTGTTGNQLEFQIRKDGNPVDPLDYLPPH